MIKLTLNTRFTRSPVHSVLIVNGKQTWLVVLEGGSSSELKPPITVLRRGRIREIEEEIGRRRDAGRMVQCWDAGMTQ